jgi:pilus assembly protein CpaB
MKKNFFARKILAVTVAGIAVAAVYFYTDSTIQQKVAPTTVVVAKQDIPPHTKITEDMLMVVPDIPRKALPQENPYASSLKEVVGKWTVDGYGIPAKGFVNTKKIVPKDQLPDAGLLNLKPGEYAFPILVDLETSSGNAIRPDTYVDLYFATIINLNETPISDFTNRGLKFDYVTEDKFPEYFGLIASKARVVDVKDSRANKVFTTDPYTETEEAKKNAMKALPARLYTIAVDKETLEFLNKGKLKGKIIPVAHGESYVKQGAKKPIVTSDSLSEIEVTKRVIDVMTFNPKLQ